MVCGLIWGGCSPAGPGVTDESREPQYLIGLSRVNAKNFEGAVEAFQQALEANPKSAAAHFQLGCLYAEKVLDPAAAIYHYEQFLKRQPKDSNADMIRKQIIGLKHDLAEAILPMPLTPREKKKLEELTAENRQLHADLERLRNETAASAGPTNQSPKPINSISGDSLAHDSLPPANSSRSVSPSIGGRTYKVMSGDTPSSIARRHSIKVESLLAANPGLNPKRMRIDQNLTIPLR